MLKILDKDNACPKLTLTINAHLCVYTNLTKVYHPFKNLAFKFSWRDYQQKFLDDFRYHITDNHLHVVAPPGSGKTILGLEMALRLGQPTLVLAPSLTIRNQWVSRLQSFFAPQGAFVDYSTDINHLKAINFCTYQALHALHKKLGQGQQQHLQQLITKANIKTIVLDEAHHLKNEWWKALWDLKAIPDITVVALTATPPYDSSFTELNKYFQLCGPIDDEIAVPDLIKNGDLCPHQDFIHFSLPEESTLRKIVAYRENTQRFFNQLKTNQAFIQLLQQLPLYAQPDQQLQQLYEKPAFFSAILIFLNACGLPIAPQKLALLGIDPDETNIPNFNFEWCQTLLQELLFDARENLLAHEAVLLPITDTLKKTGVIQRGKLNFVGENMLYKELATSISKFKSIQEILQQASNNLKGALRAVVLVDYIGKEFLNHAPAAITDLNKMAAAPLFQYLYLTTALAPKTAILTGSVVLVPQAVMPALLQLVPEKELGLAHLKGAPQHNRIHIKGGNQNTVALLGQLFAQGHINILIGTKSLLGEGWDAPSINTLILGSYVGSFVSSNQMRGRAIRIDPEQKDKVGRIWHLACLDPTAANGGDDLQMLTKRFKAFGGVSLNGKIYIENGLDRMGLNPLPKTKDQLVQSNARMFALAAAPQPIKQRWQKAIAQGKMLINELRMPYQKGADFKGKKRFYALNVSKYLLYEVGIAGLIMVPEIILKNLKLLLHKGILGVFYVLLLVLGGRLLPKLFKAIKLYMRYGNPYPKHIKIAEMLISLAADAKQITSQPEEVSILAHQKNNGWYSIGFEGLSLQESTLLTSYLEEIILPVDNPRYMMLQNRFKRFFGYQQFYAVPKAFAQRKESAQQFARFWNKHVGGGQLQYTRTPEGRKLLVQARLSHVLYQFVSAPEQLTVWK